MHSIAPLVREGGGVLGLVNPEAMADGLSGEADLKLFASPG